MKNKVLSFKLRLEEKLEIMEWLSEKGFEPSQQFIGSGHAYSIEPFGGELSSEQAKPWFNLEQVLELLPKELDRYNLTLSRGLVGYKPPFEKGGWRFASYGEASGYHLAALRLLKSLTERDLGEGEKEV